MTNKRNSGFLTVGGKPLHGYDSDLEYRDIGAIDPEFPCELVEPLYKQVDIKAKTPEALRTAVKAAIEAVTAAKEEESPEKPSSIALRVAAQQKDVKARLCVVFPS